MNDYRKLIHHLLPKSYGFIKPYCINKTLILTMNTDVQAQISLKSGQMILIKFW